MSITQSERPYSSTVPTYLQCVWRKLYSFQVSVHQNSALGSIRCREGALLCLDVNVWQQPGLNELGGGELVPISNLHTCLSTKHNSYSQRQTTGQTMWHMSLNQFNILPNYIPLTVLITRVGTCDMHACAHAHTPTHSHTHPHTSLNSASSLGLSFTILEFAGWNSIAAVRIIIIPLGVVYVCATE